MLHEIVRSWEDVLYSCSYLYWSQWDLPGAQYFLKSGHIFRFLNKDFQKDLGSMTLSGQSPNLLFLSQQLWGSFHFFSSFASLSFWWDQPMAAKPSQDKRCKDPSTPCMTVPRSAVTSLLFHFTFHICPCTTILLVTACSWNTQMWCLNCPLSGSNSQILKIIILETVLGRTSYKWQCC